MRIPTAKAADIANSHAGFLFQKGAIDFAGGTVVHINAGIAALIAALMLGPRKGYGKVPMAPHSLMMTAIGTGLLWMGWFGFNAGSALEATGAAGLAFFNTLFGTAVAGVTWTVVEWIVKGKPSSVGHLFRHRCWFGGDHSGCRFCWCGRCHGHLRSSSSNLLLRGNRDQGDG